jgi:hypothetical protein
LTPRARRTAWAVRDSHGSSSGGIRSARSGPGHRRWTTPSDGPGAQNFGLDAR